MQRLEVENEVELADVFEQSVKCLNEDLYEVEEGKRRFGGGTDDDEVEGGIVTICYKRRGVVVLGCWRGGLGCTGEQRWETRALSRF